MWRKPQPCCLPATAYGEPEISKWDEYGLHQPPEVGKLADCLEYQLRPLLARLLVPPGGPLLPAPCSLVRAPPDDHAIAVNAAAMLPVGLFLLTAQPLTGLGSAELLALRTYELTFRLRAGLLTPDYGGAEPMLPCLLSAEP